MNRDHSVILAVAPVSRGFGLVVVSSDGTLVDWRVREIHEPTRRKNARCVFELEKLFDEHRPRVLVLDDYHARGAKKRKRIRQLLDALAELAVDSGIDVARYGPREVRAALALPPGANKDRLASAVATHAPALARRVPKPRRLWESEQYVMPIFVAFALAFTHLRCAQRKDRTP